MERVVGAERNISRLSLSVIIPHFGVQSLGARWILDALYWVLRKYEVYWIKRGKES